MNNKHFLGLAVVTTFAIKGLYRLHQYNNRKSDYTRYLADIANDGIDGVNDLVHVFSNNKQEVELCDDISKITKNSINFITEADRRQ